MPDLVLTTQPVKSRKQRIRDEFGRVGPMGTAELGRHLIAVGGFYSDDELASAHLRFVQGEIRDALKEPDEAGLPFAGKTCKSDEGGSPVWMRRELWQFDDYVLNVGDLLKQRDTLHREAQGLAAECVIRFGRSPFVSEVLPLAAD